MDVSQGWTDRNLVGEAPNRSREGLQFLLAKLTIFAPVAQTRDRSPRLLGTTSVSAENLGLRSQEGHLICPEGKCCVPQTQETLLEASASTFPNLLSKFRLSTYSFVFRCKVP